MPAAVSAPAKTTRPAATGAPAPAVRRGLSEGWRRLIVATVFFALLLAAWHFISANLTGRQRLLFPDPTAVGTYLAHGFQTGDIWTALWVTARRLLVGYFAGLLVGIPLGIVTARFRWAGDTIGVLGLGLQTLPSVCWVPLALLWFGQSEGAMLFVVIMGTIWSVQIAVDSGVRNVPPIFARAARTMGSKGLHTWWYVIIPASLPFIVSGVKQGWAFAWRSLMAAEISVTILTGFGLGQLLHYGRDMNAMDQVIGVMLVIVLIGLLADKILFSPWERFFYRRWGTAKN